MNHYAKPIKFFAFTLLLTWAAWFAAAYFSHQPGGEGLHLILTIIGSNIPFFAALFMVLGSGNRGLKRDFGTRLIGGIHLRDLPALLLLLPATMLLSIAISLLFGGSAEQFAFSELFSSAGLAGLLISILAPTFEELGWRGYGMDSLRSRSSLLKSSLLFTLLWAIWHVPLFFANGNYQNELVHLGVPYVINFFVSLLPATIIMNWIYYRNGRSTLAAILFHIMMVLTAEAFLVQESVKFIQTGVLLVVAAGLVLYDRTFFMADGAPADLKKAS
ncbi:MAG: hypothetical protein K0R39_322 [Symbiobacteriaceae bacterium]|jgi:membrane protease YdiL (CAAX protease family)|nr:hypothetical protein [Symbiobacteriaceae bacterium]